MLIGDCQQCGSCDVVIRYIRYFSYDRPVCLDCLTGKLYYGIFKGSCYGCNSTEQPMRWVTKKRNGVWCSRLLYCKHCYEHIDNFSRQVLQTARKAPLLTKLQGWLKQWL